ncbi:MAG: hypothetical protein ACLQUZ_17045 [Rhizomicrobium sp.]
MIARAYREEKMKLSTKACASIAAFAAFVLTADGAFAAVNYNTSKSNSGNFVITNPNDEKACTSQGGTVSSKNGQKVCSKAFTKTWDSSSPK